MKHYFLRKKIFALLFVLGLGTFSAVNMYQAVPILYEDYLDGELQTIADLEQSINTSLLCRMDFIELFGYSNKLMDKREVKNFTCIQDEEGFMHYASFFQEPDKEIFHYARRVKRIQNAAAKNGAKTLFVLAPAKYHMDHALRTGLPLYQCSPATDELLFSLNRLGVEVLNLQKYLPGEAISFDELFFKTDHHWTIPGAFEGTRLLVQKLEEMGCPTMDPDHLYLNPQSFEQITYSDVMLGSMGRKSGANYSGLEDFTCLWPRFEGSYSRQWVTLGGKDGASEGNFIEALMNPEYLEKHDIYSRESLYGIYLKELNAYEKIENKENPEGPKVLMVRDSFFSPVMAFMMPMCSQMEAVWGQNLNPDYQVEDLVEKNAYDYVIVEIYPYGINDEGFNYFKE